MLCLKYVDHFWNTSFQNLNRCVLLEVTTHWLAMEDELCSLVRMDLSTKEQKHIYCIFKLKKRKILPYFCLCKFQFSKVINEVHISEELLLIEEENLALVINLVGKYSSIISEKNAKQLLAWILKWQLSFFSSDLIEWEHHVCSVDHNGLQFTYIINSMATMI